MGPTEGHGPRASRAVQARVVLLMHQPAGERGVGCPPKGVCPRPPVPQGTKAIPRPDLLRPAAVGAYDLGMGGGLPLGRKDRDASTDQTESGPLPSRNQADCVDWGMGLDNRLLGWE